MWRNNLTEREKNTIIENYKMGLTYKEITKKYGFSASSICHLVKGMRSRSLARINAQVNGKWLLSDEGRLKLSENGKKACIRSGKFWTKPERFFRELLLEMEIGVKFPDHIKEVIKIEDDEMEKAFCYQYPIQRYIVDFVDPENKVAININGDYWHGNPLLYNVANLGKMQKINVRQDNNKRIFLEKNGWKVIDIWESEIYWNKDLVKDKVRAISLTGKLRPYTAATGVQLSHCPPDWSESIKRLWFKKSSIPSRKKKPIVIVVCCNCGKSFETTNAGKRTHKYCSKGCSCVGSRKVKIRPSKEELVNLMSTMSMRQIGKKYDISDNAVRKWAKTYNILD